MRLGAVLSILAFVVLGAVFGALNGERVAFDLYFVEFSQPKGAVLLAVLALGWLLGGLTVWLARVPHLRRQLRDARRARDAALASVDEAERSARAAGAGDP